MTHSLLQTLNLTPRLDEYFDQGERRNFAHLLQSSLNTASDTYNSRHLPSLHRIPTHLSSTSLFLFVSFTLTLHFFVKPVSHSRVERIMSKGINTNCTSFFCITFTSHCIVTGCKQFISFKILTSFTITAQRAVWFWETCRDQFASHYRLAPCF